jgi:RimJ/RimL family protein N-acetyltransferase
MTAEQFPVGPPMDAKPARALRPVTLAGRFGTVERLDATRHGADLWAEFRGDDAIWTYMSYGPFARAEEFSQWLALRETLADPYSYSVLDARRRACGLVAFVNIQAAMRSVEVAHVVFGPALQRTPLATEAQYLLARHAFETLGYRRYEWKCNSLNAASRRAALRLGFTFEGIFRQHMIVKGRSRDTAWFSMLDGEWPARKAAFERWLAPENFDREGRQKTSLAGLQQAQAPR